MTWSASAPANIALIKYMGKSDSSKNLPFNASLSYSLEHCRTFVELELTDALNDNWQVLEIPNAYPMQLSEQGKSRFLQHLQFLKQKFHCSKTFIVKSVNNFPADCGLASSASSYAALTKVACLALAEITQCETLSNLEMAQLSQQGSGSSCRSFYSPWCIWQENIIKSIELPYQTLLHQIIVVDQEKKSVSSSDAHKRVQTSALYNGRKERAEDRLANLLQALTNNDWQTAYTLCWQELWDMHALFETTTTPFGYMTADSSHILSSIRGMWQRLGDGPLATMDAGPNVHVLFREDQFALAEEFANSIQISFKIIKSY